MSGFKRAEKTWSLSRRRGWLKVESEEQALDWRVYCFENGLDCLCLCSSGQEYEIRVEVEPRQPMSELAYLELEELLRVRGCQRFCLGSWTRANGGEFSLCFSKRERPSEWMEDIQALLRRDRTSQRAAELSNRRGPVEGWAVLVKELSLWEDHRAEDGVYILETGEGTGRCLAFKHLHPPLVDLPLDAFRILPSQDV